MGDIDQNEHLLAVDAEAAAGKASAEPLLRRLEGVQKSGLGWRARCPNCGGRSRKLTIALKDERVLLHCFACHDSAAVLATLGLTWADLHPARHWPQTAAEHRAARDALREAGLMAAIEVLAGEASVIEAAGRQLQRWQCLSPDDDERLSVAVERASNAGATLAATLSWRCPQ